MTDLTDPRDILISPVISEKSYGLLDDNKYTFVVRPDANKTQIKIAVEKVFGVKVSDVNTSTARASASGPRRGSASVPTPSAPWSPCARAASRSSGARS